MKLITKITLVTMIIFMTGCSQKEYNTNVECVYPNFPKTNNNVKIILKDLNNKDINLWVNELVNLKEQLNYLEEVKSERTRKNK